MKPEDLHFRPDELPGERRHGPRPRQQGQRRRALLATGHVFELSDDFPPATLRAMLTIAGGEAVEGVLDSIDAKVIDAPPASRIGQIEAGGRGTVGVEFEIDEAFEQTRPAASPRSTASG